MARIVKLGEIHEMNYTEIRLPYSVKTGILAVGGQSKAAFCVAKGNRAYLFYSGGNLSDLGSFKRYEREIKLSQKKFKIKPAVVAYDLHPEYISTKYALRVMGRSLIAANIQHHEAHIASCITDNSIKGNVIGVAFDGAGFGRDRNIWGGEFFTGCVKGLKRAAHLRYIPMPGGDASVKEPWRMAFSYLYAIYGKSAALKTLTALDKEKISMLSQMMDKKINSPLTSSMGRLFDGVSSLIGLCSFAKHEAEAAVELEKIIFAASRKPQAADKYKFKYIDKNGITIIDWAPVIKNIVRDLRRSVKQPEISLKFHNAVCDMVKNVCNILRRKHGINKVCMSGGVFQNKYLAGCIRPMLEKEGFEAYLHKNIPTNDAGIALGQAALACQIREG